MRQRVPLLMRGNGKLGTAIHAWSLPAVESCPGSTKICRDACYARRQRFRFSSVRRRLQWNWRQCRRDDFVDRMVSEIHSQGVLVLRLHVSGDFWSAAYVRKWFEIMKRAPRVRYFGYTRSWRTAGIAAELEKLASLSCMRLWYSFDDESGIPDYVPPDVKLAFLQVRNEPIPTRANLAFRVRQLRHLPALPVVCPTEAATTHSTRITCGACARCFE